MDIYCDGLCEPENPGGHACWGFVMIEDRIEQHAMHGYIGCGDGMTNNLAEYTAVLKALEWAYKAGHKRFIIKTDSQLVVKQSQGEWACNAANLQPLCQRVQKGLKACDASIAWIPREQNTRADALTRLAYAKVSGNARNDMSAYVAALEALDSMEQELDDGFETEFVSSNLERARKYGPDTKFSEKQKACIRKLVEEYLSPEQAAELMGQERML